MKIGYFITLFPYAQTSAFAPPYQSYPVGGGENVAYNLAQHMNALGHDITVFTTSTDSHTYKEDYNGIQVLRYGTNLKLDKAYFSLGYNWKPLYHDLDIVHLHYTTPPGNIAARIYTGRTHKPFVVTYHGDMPEGFGSLIRRTGVYLYNRLEVHGLLAHANVIISPSDHFINQSRFLPDYKDKIVTIPNGIDFDTIEVPYSREECRQKLGFSSLDKIILFVGSFIRSKNPHLLLQAMPLILKRIPKAKLVLAGFGPMAEELEKIACELGIEHRTCIPGPIAGETKALYYNAADVFAFPSISEVFPIVLLEAGVAGLPIVASTLETLKTFVEERYNGLIVDVTHIENLAEGIIELLSNPDLCQQMGANSKAKAMNYPWEKIAQQTEAIYHRICSNSGS